MLIPLTPFVWSALQVSLLGVVTLLISWVLRGRHPQWTSAMLAGSCLAALTLTVIVWLPISHWSVARLLKSYGDSHSRGHPFTSQQRQDQPAVAAQAERTNSPQESLINPLPQTSPGHQQSALREYFSATTSWLSFHLQGMDASLRDYESRTAIKSAYFWRLQVLSVVMISWLGGLWLSSWLWIRTIIAHSVPIDDRRATARLQELSKRIGLRFVPELLESNKVAIGATVGARRYRLILNSRWQVWSDEELEAVMLHELAHMIRHDYMWVVLGSWIRVLLFYHPLIHALVCRWRMEQELAADQLAAGAMQSARAYGRALAKLALRAQGGAQVPSPALTAEQVCIVRRITMLRQGSLKPQRNRGRWHVVIFAMTILIAAPLSSLRGTPPGASEPPSAEPASAMGKDAVDESKDAIKQRDELIARRQEFDLTQKEFPPSTYVGKLKWEPRKLLSNDVSPSLRYMQDLVAFVLFEQLPENAKIQAPATVVLNWETRQREQGRLSFGATCNESQGIDPKFILRMLTNPRLTNFRPSSVTKTIAGRQATKLVATGVDPVTGIAGSTVQPDYWFVQEGESFYFGSELDVSDQIEGKVSPQRKDALIDVPEVFREDYDAAAFALVFDDCERWSDRLRDFFAGSPKQASLFLIQPYLRGLKRIGVFISGKNGVSLDFRVGYQSDTAAKDGAEALQALLGLIKATADPSEPFVAEFLDGMKMRTVDSEVRVQFSDAKLVEKLCDQILPDCATGWTDILSLHEPSPEPGTAQLACRDYFALTGFLAQSVNAKNYRGKRVRFSADIGGTEDVQARSGTIVWGSDHDMQTVGNASSGKTIGTPTDTQKVLDVWKRTVGDDIVWRTKSVEWNVPANADALSFGVYLAAGDVKIRHMKFEVIGPATSDQAETELVNLPRNLLKIPHRQLLDAPTNLDFSQGQAHDEAAGTRTADRDESSTKSGLRK